MSIKLQDHWFTRTVYSKAMAHNLVKLFYRHYEPRPETFDSMTVKMAAQGRDEGAEGKARVQRHSEFKKHGIPAMEKLRKKGGLTLRDVDDVLTASLGGPPSEGEFPFNGAKEYYEWASPYKLLHNVQR